MGVTIAGNIQQIYINLVSAVVSERSHSYVIVFSKSENHVN